MQEEKFTQLSNGSNATISCFRFWSVNAQKSLSLESIYILKWNKKGRDKTTWSKR